MIEITLQSGEEIRLPITVDDVPAKAWYEMSARERELEKLGDKVEPADFIRYVTEAVKAVVDIPDNLAFGLPVKAMLKKEWQLTPEFIASVKTKGVDTIEATVLNIYRHLIFVTRTFVQCEFPIEYDGSTWNITPNIKGIAYEGEFSAMETVEVLRLEQMFEKELAEARKNEFNFTAIAAADYGLSQVQMAILLRPVVDGVIEPLPMGEQAIERYINERVTELEKMPYSVILSVRAFFFEFFNGCFCSIGDDKEPKGNAEYAPYWIGIERPGDFEGMEQKDIDKMKRISKKRGKQITDLIGWRHVYPDIQKCGYFGRSLQEVYNVGFKTAVHAMNLNLVTGN